MLMLKLFDKFSFKYNSKENIKEILSNSKYTWMGSTTVIPQIV